MKEDKAKNADKAAEAAQQQQQSIIDMLLGSVLKPETIINNFNGVKTSRSSWSSKWNTIQTHVFPNYRDYADSPRIGANPNTNQIKNHTSSVSGKINKIVSCLSSQITDPSVKWLDLKFRVGLLENNEAVKAWLEHCKEKLYSLFSDPESNFYPSTFSFHLDWFTIGTSCREIIIRKDTGKIRFNTISMQDIYIELNGYGDIGNIYRSLNVTAKQAVDLWGDRVHRSQLEEAKKLTSANGSESKKYEYVEIVMPNPLKELIPVSGYVSCVVDTTNRNVVDIGMHKFPTYVVSRFLVAPNEVYGKSYVWNAMPDIIAINKVSKRILQCIDYTTLPLYLVQDASSVKPEQMHPGAFFQGLDNNGRATVQPMSFGGNPEAAMRYYDLKLRDLEESLVAIDIFAAENPNMTATEVNERKIQANNRLRPILVRLEKEDLNHVVKKSLDLLMSLNQIMPFPYEEAGVPPEMLPMPIEQLDVSFSGQMSRMQRLQEVQDNEMLLQKTIQAAQVDRSVLDRINLDAVISQDAEIFGVSQKIINSDDVVTQIRKQRAEQAEAQSQAENEQKALDAAIKIKELNKDE